MNMQMLEIANTLPAVSAVIGTVLMALLLCALLLRYFASTLAPESKIAGHFIPKRMPKGETGNWKKALLYAAVFFVASRVFIAAATAVYALVTGKADGYFAYFYDYWAKWDAPHYIGLIKNWYVNEGDARFHIVFFPMYPLVCRILLSVFGGSAQAWALFVSNLCGWLAGAVLYRLTSLDYGEKTAARAARLFFLNPLSFFLSLPYTESMFLLLTIGAVYLARRRKFFWAIVLGALCAACRLMGVVVAIPIFYAMLSLERDQKTLNIRRFFVRFAQCLGILAGVAAYLLLNWHVTGNPFQFWIYQRDHWYNTTGTLWNTFSYMVRYAFDGSDAMRIPTWCGTIVLVYGAIIALYARMRRANTGDLAYGWAYMYMTIVPTWLISGPRYVSGLYALYPILADLTRRKWADIALTTLFLIGLAYMACMFVFTSGVY